MKTETLRKVNAHSVMITLFFIGIILSGGCLYLLVQGALGDAMLFTSLLTGGTYLAGIFSISLASRAARQNIVYLERKSVSAENNNNETRIASGKIVPEHLEKFLGSAQLWLNELCRQLEAAQAAVYVADSTGLELKYGYAIVRQNTSVVRYEGGEGLVGRVAKEKITLRIDEVPEGYITVFSGLGAASPLHLVLIPIKTDDHVAGVLEIASFTAPDEITVRQIESACAQLASRLSSTSN